MEKKEKKFRLSAKSFFLTYPKCEASKEDCMKAMLLLTDWEYVGIASELHEDLTPHLHVLAIAKEKLNVKKARYFDFDGYHGNYQTARKNDDVLKYISKIDKDLLVHGEFQSNSQSVVQRRAAVNKHILGIGLSEPCKLIEEGIIHISQYKSILENINRYKLDKQIVTDHIVRECIWIVGRPRIGKTWYVRSTYPGCYIKAQNKWWDGYTGQDVVLIDDVDSDCLGHYMKIWADNYSFGAEVKGGTITPTYTKLFVTSNYYPSEIFKDTVMAAAITARFVIANIEDSKLILP